jgi:hypothetical protein
MSFIVQAPGWKGFPETNILAYYENSSITAVKSFITLGQEGDADANQWEVSQNAADDKVKI